MLGLVTAGLTSSVVVPSYRRPHHLRRCLAALLAQELVPDQIIVVARADDQATRAVIAEVQRDTEILSLATVSRPGVLAAMEVGVRHARSDVVAFTDDDARPRKDWLARLTSALQEDPRAAGVGGRDNYPDSSAVTGERTVGHLAWFGRITGNHHLGTGPRRTVTVLKGVNCAYRREVLEQLGFDHRLRGGGAQVHWELALGLAIARRGWRLLYDPGIMVEHEEAPRLDGQRVGAPHPEETAVADAAYNEALLLTEHLRGARGLAYILWSAVVGHRASPGLAQAVRLTPILRGHSWRRWSVTRRARREARLRARTRASA